MVAIEECLLCLCNSAIINVYFTTAGSGDLVCKMGLFLLATFHVLYSTGCHSNSEEREVKTLPQSNC